MLTKEQKALLEYQKQCTKTAERAYKAMVNCINNGSFEHYEKWVKKQGK